MSIFGGGYMFPPLPPVGGGGGSGGGGAGGSWDDPACPIVVIPVELYQADFTPLSGWPYGISQPYVDAEGAVSCYVYTHLMVWWTPVVLYKPVNQGVTVGVRQGSGAQTDYVRQVNGTILSWQGQSLWMAYNDTEPPSGLGYGYVTTLATRLRWSQYPNAWLTIEEFNTAYWGEGFVDYCGVEARGEAVAGVCSWPLPYYVCPPLLLGGGVSIQGGSPGMRGVSIEAGDGSLVLAGASIDGDAKGRVEQ